MLIISVLVIGISIGQGRILKGNSSRKLLNCFIINDERMKPSQDVLIMLILLAGYFYTTHCLHSVLRKIDQKGFLSLYVAGKLEVTAMIRMCHINEPQTPYNAKMGLRLIRLNNFIVFLSFGLVIICLFSEAIKK